MLEKLALMLKKELVQQAAMFFVAGVVASVVVLTLLDITQASAMSGASTSRPNVAQRSNLPTRTSVPTLEPSATVEVTDTPALIADLSSPTPDLYSTATSTLQPTFTPTVITSPVPISPSPTARRISTPLARGTPGATATPTKDPRRGESPFTAINLAELTDAWLTINPGANIWYRVGEKTSYPLRLQIWLDAYGRSGIGFSVFSPEQAKNLNDLTVLTQPKGRGGSDKTAGHDLVWEGGSANTESAWYVLVTNSNPTPLQYKVNSSYTTQDHKNCVSYWEPPDKNHPNDAPWWWTACK